MKNKLNIKNLIITILLFMALFRTYIMSYNQFLYFSLFLSAILIIISRPSLKNIKKNITIILFAMCIFISTYFFRTNTYNLLNGLRYSLQFLALYFMTNKLIEKDGLKSTIKSYFLVSFVMTTIMDITVFLNIDFDKIYYQNLTSYIFGNKFILSYLHLQTFSLMIFNDNINKNINKNITKNQVYKYLIYSIFSLVTCIYINCLTGVIGIIVFFLTMCIPQKKEIKEIMIKPSTIFLFLLIIQILLFCSQIIYETSFGPYIASIINKGNSLNGRFIIYKKLPEIIFDKPLIGYGYNSTVITNVLGYGNAQNGLLQFLLDLGIIGLFLFLINVYESINIKFENKNWPLYCALYSFIVCSIFEVCFKFSFFIILCLIFNIGLLQKTSCEDFSNGE